MIGMAHIVSDTQWSVSKHWIKLKALISNQWHGLATSFVQPLLILWQMFSCLCVQIRKSCNSPDQRPSKSIFWFLSIFMTTTTILKSFNYMFKHVFVTTRSIFTSTNQNQQLIKNQCSPPGLLWPVSSQCSWPASVTGTPSSLSSQSLAGTETQLAFPWQHGPTVTQNRCVVTFKKQYIS